MTNELAQPQSVPTEQLEQKQPVSNLPKLGILEEDDEFEEFPVEDWDNSGELKLDVEQWDYDWDDDNIDDEFSVQLRAELQKQGITAK